MIKILFLIHDLGGGGAENVLVNLVNNLNRDVFEVTVLTLFDVGENRKRLAPHIRYKSCFKNMIPGNSHLMKILTPAQLHKWLIKEHYDIEVAYLEGPSARVISGCPNKDTKLYSWIHCTMKDEKMFSMSFRSANEAKKCYDKFERIVCVSQGIQKAFVEVSGLGKKTCVLYNTVESDVIRQLAKEPLDAVVPEHYIKLIAVGTLKEVKGFDRLLRVINKLVREGYPVYLFLLGKGILEDGLRSYVTQNNLQDRVSFVGFQTNPYKYLKNSDIFICSSYSEGFSTAATEALIVGTPVCTVEVSGMKEMLGENNEYGIVTANSEDALYQGIKSLLDDPDLLKHYRKQAKIRGKIFSTENTVSAVEEMLLGIR